MNINKHRSGGSKSGFTLVEIAIVVTLAALVSLMTLPNVIARLPTYRLDSAADRINTHLQMARMKAMAEGQYVGIKFNSSADGYAIWSTPLKNGEAAEGTLASYGLRDLKGVLFQTYPSQGYFSPGGSFSAGSSSGTMLWIWVYSESTREQRSVVVWPSGQVSIYRYGGADA